MGGTKELEKTAPALFARTIVHNAPRRPPALHPDEDSIVKGGPLAPLPARFREPAPAPRKARIGQRKKGTRRGASPLVSVGFLGYSWRIAKNDRPPACGRWT